MKLQARLEAPWLREGALADVLLLLDGGGEEARLVGGTVRNALLQEPLGDIDIATTALPQEVIRRAEAAGLKAVATGVEHGTVTLVLDGRPFEVTTLRKDVETFGRRARVAFGRDWRADAERRDFTINALFLSRDGAIDDFVGGLADLEARRVRFIGDPAQRIAEDFLRILRFFRFHAAYGEGSLDAAGLVACIRGRSGLDSLSRERVRMEILKLLVARDAIPTAAAMSEAGLLGAVIGGVPQLASISAMSEIEALLSLPADAVRRLGALAVSIPEDAERLRERLRLANAEFERLAAMADGWWKLSSTMTEHAARDLLYRQGPEQFTDRAMLAWSRTPEGAGDQRWRNLASLPERWTAPKFPLKAADFLSRGLKGPPLGAALRAAETAWIEAGFPHDGASLADIVDRVSKKL